MTITTSKSFHVIDIPSGLTVKKFSDKVKAQKEADRLDHQERGFRYRVEEYIIKSKK